MNKQGGEIHVSEDTHELLWRNKPQDWSWDKYLRELLYPYHDGDLEREYPGQTQELDCVLCEDTTEHYLYHDNTWVCVECGE